MLPMLGTANHKVDAWWLFSKVTWVGRTQQASTWWNTVKDQIKELLCFINVRPLTGVRCISACKQLGQEMNDDNDDNGQLILGKLWGIAIGGCRSRMPIRRHMERSGLVYQMQLRWRRSGLATTFHALENSSRKISWKVVESASVPNPGCGKCFLFQGCCHQPFPFMRPAITLLRWVKPNIPHPVFRRFKVPKSHG